MSRLGALLALVLAFVGFVAAPVSHADYRKLFKAPAGYIERTQDPQVRERTRREYHFLLDPAYGVDVGERAVLVGHFGGQRRQAQESLLSRKKVAARRARCRRLLR